MRTIVVLPVVDCDLSTYDEKRVSMYDYRRAFVNSDSQKGWMGRYHGIKVLLAATRIDMLIDGGIGQQPEARIMPRNHHDSAVTSWVSAIARRTSDQE